MPLASLPSALPLPSIRGQEIKLAAGFILRAAKTCAHGHRVPWLVPIIWA